MNFFKALQLVKQIPLTRIDNFLKLLKLIKAQKQKGRKEIGCKIRIEVKGNKGKRLVVITPPEGMSEAEIIDLSLYLQCIFNQKDF